MGISAGGYENLRVITVLDANNRPEKRLVAASFYVYPITLDFSLVGEQIDGSITLLQDSYFELTQITDNHAATFDFLLVDGSTQRQVFNAPVPKANITGTGQLPFNLPDTYIFRPKGVIEVRATNGPSTAVNKGKLTFIGARLFDRGPAV
jgi:hypothetical protein